MDIAPLAIESGSVWHFKTAADVSRSLRAAAPAFAELARPVIEELHRVVPKGLDPTMP